ncbi:TasA family protein [Cellulomonas soli]|uniref:TasA family protein n=1 Tax=Cellulomonas soli TaxID=931535 RepID=UPI003F84699E
MIDDLLQEMIDPAPAPRDKPRRRRLWATVAIVGLSVVGATSLTTSALFTDNDTVNAAITSGTVDIAGGDLTFTMPSGGLAPGDAVVAPVTVDNDGSLELRYAVRYSAAAGTPGTPPDLETPVVTGALQDALSLSLFDLDGAACTADATAAAVGTAAQLTTTGFGLAGTDTALLGSSAPGAQDGDRVLAALSAEELCVRVDFDAAAGNEFQSLTTDITLRFVAEQTVNN